MMRFAYKTGTRPLDGYTIKRGVGVGGFGEVYFAVSDAGKEVALKRVQRNLDVEVRGVRQCLNLKHPNLIALYDLKYDDEGQVWVVMEYVAGESLKDVIDRNPNGLPGEELQRWFEGIAAGVCCLHDHGIVHRDLKPGNIFEDDGVIKIGDYGLSKFMSASRRSGQTESVGTFHYMAPEIGRGVYGREIDVYALGIMLFEMLTGHVPFEGESSQEIIMKHLTDEPDLSAVPQPFGDVLRRSLKKDPTQRYATVPELVEAVRACFAGDNDSVADSQPTSRETPAEPTFVLESRVKREEPIYIGDEPEVPPAEEISFGPMREREIVMANTVPPVRTAPAKTPHPVPVSAAAARPQPAPRSQPTRPPQTPHPHDSAGSRGMPGSAKVLLAIAIGLVLIFNPWLIPVAAVVGVLYGLVLLVRLAFGRRSAAKGGGCPFRETPIWRRAAREAMKRKPLSERTGELTGSMLSGALIVAALNFVFVLLMVREAGTFPGESVAIWGQYAWLTVTGTVGTWLLLLAGKAWEGSEGDALHKYVVLLILGLVLGTVAFGAAQMLMASLPDFDQWTDHGLANSQLARSLYSHDGTPLWGAFLVYFGGLFAVLRWWSQTDPLRRSRMSLWATGICILWAWVLHMFCRFPQPWGLMLAASISVAVQLSATWLHPRDRVEIGQGMNQA